MNLRRILAGLLAAAVIAVQPAQAVLAEEESVKTEDENAKIEEEKAKQEEEKKASFAILPDTNSLENWPEGPAVYAQSAIVMDMESGAVLYAKKPDERHYPASITKLLTTLVALENGMPEDRVTFSQESVDILNWDDANIGMRPGEEISMKDALYAVLLASANEVSYAVAESIGQICLNGGYDTFIELMNKRSKELGCTGSNWVNPNGLHDEDHYTTAYDMALIASAVYQKEEFREIMNTLEYRIPPTNLEEEERVFQQNHRMLWEGNDYYYEYCTGGKTGYTDQSMTTLVTMADNGEMQLAAVVLYDYGVDAYTDTRAMMDYVFHNFSKVPVSELDAPDQIERYTNENAYAVLPGGVDVSDVECTIIPEDGTYGEAVYTYQGQTVGKTEVILKEGSLVKAADTADAEDRQKTEEEKGKKEQREQKEKKNLVTVICLTGVGVSVILLLIFWGRRRITTNS